MRIGPHDLGGIHLLAPMAGLVSTPFRGIALEHGAAASPTELISATALARKNRKTVGMVERAPGERLFWVQLFGADPDIMARAALRAVELGAQLVDVNMGCPVRKVTSDGAGSALMQDVPRAVRMIAAIRAALPAEVPVTAKIRAGWDHDSVNCVDMGRALEQVGVAALCLHARTRAQRYAGQANWQLIAELKHAVGVPVIGNGDVGCVADARAMVEQTGCDGVMVGRAALGNPWIFTGLRLGRDIDPTPAQRAAVVVDHFRRLQAQVGDPDRALQRFRSRMLYYTRGLDGGVEFRRQVVRIHDPAALELELQRYFGSATRARGFRPGRDGAMMLGNQLNQPYS